MAAALKATRAVELATRVLAIELLCACQPIDLLKPLSTSPALARVHDFVRTRVAVLDEDRPPSIDIDRLTSLIERGELERACAMKVN
jgi:histidine ammonia-lyase